MEKFIIIVHAARQHTIKPTDEFLLRAWEILCHKHHGATNIEVIRALLQIEYKTKVSISSQTAFALNWDVAPPCDGAVLWPEEYQPWERIGKVLCDRHSDGSFSLTDHGSIVKDILMDEITKHYKKEISTLNTNKYKLPLSI